MGDRPTRNGIAVDRLDRSGFPSVYDFVAFLLLVTWVIHLWATGPSVAVIPAGDLNRQSEFDKTLAALQKRADLAPNNPETWHTLAEYYSEKVRTDASLPRDLAKTYVMRGLALEDRALALSTDYYEAMSLKDILLRQRALYEKDPAVQKRLIAEADAYRQRAAAVAARGKKAR